MNVKSMLSGVSVTNCIVLVVDLIEHDPEGEEVSARAKILGTHLFGRHMSDGAEGGAGASPL